MGRKAAVLSAVLWLNATSACFYSADDAYMLNFLQADFVHPPLIVECEQSRDETLIVSLSLGAKSVSVNLSAR